MRNTRPLPCGGSAGARPSAGTVAGPASGTADFFFGGTMKCYHPIKLVVRNQAQPRMG